MDINAKSPKTVSAAVLGLAALFGGGALLGLTIEPQETTELRVENATLRERTENLEVQVETLQAKVESCSHE